jgi:hypothetical protein
VGFLFRFSKGKTATVGEVTSQFEVVMKREKESMTKIGIYITG